MSRVQLALRALDLGAANASHTKLLGTEPAKLRDGLAGFAIGETPLELVLIEGAAGEDTRMDHLGVEVETTDAVHTTIRLSKAGLATAEEKDTTCRYTVQDKVWVHGPSQKPREVYGIKADANAHTRQEGSTCRSNPAANDVSAAEPVATSGCC
ncbi:ArsI/CadI family heavy metal resistance metalloenzyme [Streptomyces sp. NPDC051098]|uniref:ArsI/CadI family heavy metal resistance metalloenzyme n=1 Tax=Streptomyces sp. NPDC051098 TaxID=3155411 RepID=UPI0034353BBF